MPEPSPLPLVFRPAVGLRIVSSAAGVVCGIAAVGNLALAGDNPALRLAAAAVLSAPTLLAVGIARRRIIVDTDGLTASGVLRTRRIPWSEVLAIEQTRRSFVIITEQGDIAAGWIAQERRDLLFRKVLELARLSLDPHEPRWGIIARFVRRQAAGRILKADIRPAKSGPEQAEP